jgi:hypothetical protein
MKYTKLAKLWDSLHSSFWFVPTLMAVLAIAFRSGEECDRSSNQHPKQRSQRFILDMGISPFSFCRISYIINYQIISKFKTKPFKTSSPETVVGESKTSTSLPCL